MDDWDPMKDAFKDRKFNTYDRGPGKNIPNNQDKTDGIELYITGIPKDLTNDGLANLFSRAGNVIRANVAVSKQPDSTNTFGFVRMGNVAEAEDAIRQLNSFKIGQSTLRVKIAMTEQEKEAKKKKKMEDEAFFSSLPSSRMAKGSDSDSDRGSIKSSRSRTVIANGYDYHSGSQQWQNSQRQGKFDGKPGILGSYPGLPLESEGRVTPDPSLISFPGRSSLLNNRFNYLEQTEFDIRSEGNFDGYNRGQGFASGHGFHHGGSYRNPGGYVHSTPHKVQGYGRGGIVNDGYGGGYRDNRQYSGYGRGYPCQNNNGYGYENFNYNDNYGYTYDENYQSSMYDQRTFLGGSRPGYGRGRSMNSSAESLTGPRKEKAARKVHVESRPCNVCSKTGSFQCSRCKTPYCSEQCQRDDWGRHREVCKDLGEGNKLSSREEDFSKKFEGQFDISVGDDIVEKMKSKVEQSTGGEITYRAKNEGKHSRGNKSDTKQSSPRSLDDGKQGHTTPKQQSQRSPKSGSHVSPKIEQESPKQKVEKESPKKMISKSPPESEVIAKKQDINYSTLPLNIETQVFLLDNSSPDHFVVLADGNLMTSACELMSTMNERPDSRSVQFPQTGMVYAAKFSVDNNWYRARVDRVDTDTVSVTYIDFGNSEKIPSNTLRYLQPDMYNLTAGTIACQLDGVEPVGESWDNTSVEAFKLLLPLTEVNQTTYKVTAMSYIDGVHKVKIKDTDGGDVGATFVEAGLAKPINMSELTSLLMSKDIELFPNNIAVGSMIDVLIVEKESPTLFYGQIFDQQLINSFQALMETLETELDKPALSPYRPKCVGEIVIAKYDDGKWYRAEVISLSSNSALCHFIDYGNKSNVIFECIQQAVSLCGSIPRIAVKMKLFGVPEQNTWLKDTTDVFDQLISLINPRKIEMEIKFVNNDIVEVDFLTENGRKASELILESMVVKSGATASNHETLAVKQESSKLTNGLESITEKPKISPPTSSPTLMTVSVPSDTIAVDGTQVEMMITEVSISSNKIYLQRAVRESAEQIEDMRKELTEYCSNNTSAYRPEEGELVCAQFPADGSWYRANVLEVNGHDFTVQFVDYGNMSIAQPADIRKILPCHFSIPRKAICCSLKGITLTDLNEKQLEDFRSAAMNVIIKVQAHEIRMDTYIATFYSRNGENINDIIKSDFPVVTSETEQQDIIMAGSIPMESIPLDGTQIPVLVTESIDMKYIYIQIYQEKYESNLQSLTNKLQTFCQSVSEPYVPTLGELVCAKFSDDGIWYRAEVKDISGNDCTVHFVDYGNQSIVKPEFIRKINSSLATMPKQSVCCNIIGVNLKSLSQERLLHFVNLAMESKVLNLQGLQEKDGYFDVKLFTAQGENLNELFATEDISEQQNVSESSKSSSEVFMVKLLPTLPLPLDGKKIDMKLIFPNDFERLYFQSEINKDKQSLELMSSQLTSYCQSNSEPYNPVKGELVCALYSEDSLWYRAEVLNINGEDIELQFVDYGNKETVKCSDIRKINKGLAEFPQFGVCCSLKGVNLKALSEETIVEFLQLTMTETVQVQAVSKTDRSYSVIVYAMSGININEKFILPTENKDSSNKKFMASDLSMKSLPLDGSKTDAVIVDVLDKDKIYLHCSGKDTEETLKEQLIALNTYCQDNSTPYKAVKGELVCALYEGAWFRAEVLDINGDVYKLLYVDYGNVAEVGSDSIRQIDEHLTLLPSQAICCRLYHVELKSLSEEEMQLLAQLLMQKILKIQTVEFRERCFIIKIFTEEGTFVNEMFSRSPVEPKSSVIVTCNVPRISLPVSREPVDSVITDVMEDCIFYLQADIQETNKKLGEILSSVLHYCSKNHTPYRPTKGEFICAQFSSDKVWYRANVEDIVDSKFHVQYVDFGNREIITESVIRKIEPSLASQPIQTLKCCLYNVPPSEDVRTILSSLVNVQIKMKVVKKDDDLYHVVLLSNNIDINEQLQKSFDASRGEDNDVKRKDPQHVSGRGQTKNRNLSIKDARKTEPPGEQFELVITHIVNPSEFYCQMADSEAIDKLAALMQSIMCRCEIEDADENFKPQVGDLVCAFYHADQGWYRGCVSEVYQTNTYLVHYSDFGNSEILSADQIRSMLPEYIEMPLLALKCSLAGLSPVGSTWDTAAIEKLRLFQEAKLEGNLAGREEDLYLLNLLFIEKESDIKIDINEQLVSDGHAKRSSDSDEATSIQQQIAALQAQLASMEKK